MKCNEREKIIFDFLFDVNDGLLRMYEKPSYLSADRARDEINNMVRDLNQGIRSDINEAELKWVLGRMAFYVRKNQTGRKWPTISILTKSLNSALSEETKEAVVSGDIEEKIIIQLESWYRKFKSCMPSLGNTFRTEALIERGTLTLSEARFYGFPLSTEREHEARNCEPCEAEVKRHEAVLAKLESYNLPKNHKIYLGENV